VVIYFQLFEMNKASARITANPEVMLVQPVIRNTRITVALLLRKLAEGASLDDLRRMYPQLKASDIQAALDTQETA
jgi:uncharacterized protein (DUF433 family)